MELCDYFEAKFAKMFLPNDRVDPEICTFVVDEQLDACGLTCPMPLLKAKLALNGLASGQVLEVFATDEGAVRDFPAFCELSPHELITLERLETSYRFIIRKG